MKNKFTILSLLLLFTISSVRGQYQDTLAILHSSKSSINLRLDWTYVTGRGGHVKVNDVNMPNGKDTTITVINNKVVLTSHGNGTFPRPAVFITRLKCNDAGLTDITDIGGTLNMANELNISKNNLTKLNLSGFNDLTSLDCSNNQLTELNLNGLTNLTWLLCHDNQLNTLNLTGLTNLIELDCSDNQLTELNLTGLTNFTQLYCYSNQLTKLNLTGLNNFNLLDCSSNQLTSLNLTGCVNLEFLFADNQSVSVPLSGSNFKNPLNFLIPNGNSIPATINGIQYATNDNLPTNLGANFLFSFPIPTGVYSDSPFSGSITLEGTPPPAIISVTGVTVNPPNLSLTVGEGTSTLIANVTPSNATNKDVTWSTNDSSVAVVSTSGVVAPVSEGTAIITATTVDGSKTAFCMVTVSPAVGNENPGSSSFAAFPNPTSGAVSVTGLAPDKTLKLYSVTGTLVGTYTAQEEVMTINLDNLSSGIYFLNFEGKTIRIIKN